MHRNEVTWGWGCGLKNQYRKWGHMGLRLCSGLQEEWHCLLLGEKTIYETGVENRNAGFSWSWHPLSRIQPLLLFRNWLRRWFSMAQWRQSWRLLPMIWVEEISGWTCARGYKKWCSMTGRLSWGDWQQCIKREVMWACRRAWRKW